MVINNNYGRQMFPLQGQVISCGLIEIQTNIFIEFSQNCNPSHDAFE